MLLILTASSTDCISIGERIVKIGPHLPKLLSTQCICISVESTMALTVMTKDVSGSDMH